MSKRVTGFILILLAISVIFGGNTVFADGEEVFIDGYVANNGNSIYEGREFDLEITIKNGNTEKITNVKISFGSGASFQPVAARDQSFAGEIGATAPNNTHTESFTMFFTGGTNKNLPITITYEIDLDGAGGDAPVERSVSTSIYIREAVADDPDSGPSVPTDYSKYKPLFELNSASIPEGKAGGSVKIPLTLTNVSSYEARDIKITPVFSAADNPFAIDQMLLYETVDKIAGQKSAEIGFQLKIDKYAEKKTYTLPIKIEYKNAYNISFTEEKLIYVNIINTNVPPQLVVMEAVSSPAEVKENETFTVTFDIWNMGTLEAENVTIDIKPNENFYILDNVTKKFLFEMKGLKSSKVTYTLKTKKKLETGTYGITALLQHKGMQAPEEYTMYVAVVGSEEEDKKETDVNIVTENVTAPMDSVLTEHPFTVSMDIRNIGTTKAENVKVTLESGDKILPQSLNIVNIPEIGPGESVPVAFSFVATKDCESRSYPIKAVIDYKNGDESVKKEQYIGVLIKSETTTTNTTLNTVPKIIISEYSFEPGIVNAGENFTLYMTFLNTSKLKAVQNMKITLVVNESSQETGSVFTPVQSSNTFYIDQLGPGETSKKEMVMYTIPDAKAKTYVVKTIFEYEYEEQNQLKTNNMEDVFGIPVVQPAKLETSDVIVQEPAFVGEPVYITAEFYNMGKVTLSNLMLKVEGDFNAKESNYFVGNFDMGNSDYYEASIIPLQAGETKGKLVFTFEDSAGASHRIEKEFTVNAMEAAPVINPGFPGGDMGVYPGMEGMDPGMMGPQAKKFPIIPVAIGAGVLVAVVVLIIVLRKRKKRKEMMLDEDI